MPTTNIVWNWGTNTDINFNPATDILDFGWFAADQFTVSEVNGTVVIAIPSNHQTYTLEAFQVSVAALIEVAAAASPVGTVGTSCDGSAVATMVHGSVPTPPLFSAGSVPCVHQLAL